MAAPASDKLTKKKSLTGPLTIAAIAMFGLSMFVLLKRAPSSSDPAPTEAKFAVPARALRVFSLNVTALDPDRAIAAINAAHPDIVMLQGVRTADVERIGRAIGMSRANEKAGDVFYPAQNFQGPETPFGNAIFSRWPLYEGRSIPNRGGSFGVWAVAMIDGAKIMVASACATDSSSQVLGTQDVQSVRQRELSMLVRAHEELGRPPMLLAGKFAQLTPELQKLISTRAESLAQEGDQLLIAAGDGSSPWKIERVDLPADVPGICVDAKPH
ncbi:MAG: endonuclease/exonuclease/phosphatase family protein [Anaerolineae bacterium]|nr:endonuclease/exonuclease/phosphatase family protein [Phycisphaerae bacterium]